MCISVGDGRGGTRSGGQREPPNKSPVLCEQEIPSSWGNIREALPAIIGSVSVSQPGSQSSVGGPERLSYPALTAAQRKRRVILLTMKEITYTENWRCQVKSSEGRNLESTRIKGTHSTLIWSSERL